MLVCASDAEVLAKPSFAWVIRAVNSHTAPSGRLPSGDSQGATKKKSINLFQIQTHKRAVALATGAFLRLMPMVPATLPPSHPG